MPIIGQNIRMNERVETNHGDHQQNEAADKHPASTRKTQTRSPMRQHVGPGEQRDEGREVEYLTDVNRCYMGGSIADHYPFVPDDEGDKHQTHRYMKEQTIAYLCDELDK